MRALKPQPRINVARSIIFSLISTEFKRDDAYVGDFCSVKSLTCERCFVFNFACTKLARGLENLVAPKVGQTLSVVTQYKDNIFDELWAGFD